MWPNSFPRRHDAEEWARDVERSIDRGLPVRRARPHESPRIFSDLITLHIDDMAGVGKPIRRSKAAVLEALKVSLGRVKIQNLTRERLVEFGKKRAKQGAGPIYPCNRLLVHPNRSLPRSGGPRD